MEKKFSKVYSVQNNLLNAFIVNVEADLSKGLHSFSIIGLTDKAVDEARDRMSAAIKNSGLKSPKQYNQKTVISLAPADVKKSGPQFDLAIAMAYLLASDQVKFDPTGKIFLGELGLDGNVHKINGTLALVLTARDAGFKEVYICKENQAEAALVDGIDVFGVDSLGDVINHLDLNKNNKYELSPTPRTVVDTTEINDVGVGFDDVIDQDLAKRGLTIAAAGGHNIALFGPPGTGKTMLAKAFTNILPSLTFNEAIEVTSIHSIAGALNSIILTKPPIRSPHHTSSYVSLVGGGTVIKPGEVTLAHRGVLFMDEFPEFDKKVINALRQPLEDGTVSISRASGNAEFPSDFILVAALNPCPCGYYGTDRCTCSAMQVQRYQQKISGPIMDRIDMWIEVGQVPHEKLGLKKDSNNTKQTDEAIKFVSTARDIQRKRGKLNSKFDNKDLEKWAILTDTARDILNLSAKKLGLSPRAYHRVVKLARTIADIERCDDINENHILEALSYRPRREF